ncbi:fasciclin-like arabinogalactan protein 21 [Cinnamomum micranthum f. kanehirae]|uniref:Fasciclin-like arabinogalactan protein 21 n=1 Tax=Cinnamomum micranthum f. kanehirae TaxID=337451 RepID=A0A3S3NDL4_9MAGN|nr:fasciclin-like arabinogalactan protein 21 [Cinnamomum micranthum f. kanehirae]
MKVGMTLRVALISLLLLIGSFSSISGFYPRNPAHPIDEIGQVIEGILGIEAKERWIGFVFGIGVSNLPPSATIFFPTENDMSEQWIMDPQIIRYHIVPRAISYWQLSKHSAADNLLPTLVPYKSINVTGDTICSVITVDNVLITHPEMFNDGSIAIHGVSSLLMDHYLKNGGPKMPSPPQTQPHKNGGPKMPSPPQTQPHKYGGPKMPSPPHTQSHKYGGPKMPSPPHTQPHNQDNNEDQPRASPRTIPFEMATGAITPSAAPPSAALSAPAPQPSASGGTSIKQVSIALLVGVWAVLLS